MTTSAPSSLTSATSYAPPATRSYAYAHWYFLATFAAVVAGFWPTFFKRMDAGTPPRNVHGITASLWYFALMAQSWLMSRGLVTWHRRIAYLIVLLVPVLSISALANTSLMLTTSIIPPFARPATAFADVTLVAQLWVLVALGLLARRNPPAHKRYMAATSLVGLPPALARLYNRLGVQSLNPIHTTFGTVGLILVALIVVDWRNGEGRWRAYPLLLVWTIVFQLLVAPVTSSAGWLAFCRWFAASL